MRVRRGPMAAFSVGSLILLVVAAPAFAVSTAFGTAFIDWSGLTFSGIGLTFFRTVSTSSVNFIPDAQDDAFDQKFGVTTFGNTSAAFGVLGGSGSSATTDTFVSSTISAFADGRIPDLMETSGSAAATRQAFFVADETGTLTVEADFSLAQALSTTGLPPTEIETAFGRSSITFDLAACEADGNPGCNLPFQGSIRDLAEFNNEVSGGDTISVADSGTLRITLPYEAGQEGVFVVRTGHFLSTTSAPIPEPSTFLLLGSGLAGLVAWRWKQSKGRKS